MFKDQLQTVYIGIRTQNLLAIESKTLSTILNHNGTIDYIPFSERIKSCVALTRSTGSRSHRPYASLALAGGLLQMAEARVGPPVRPAHSALIPACASGLRVGPAVPPPRRLPQADQPLSAAAVELLRPVRVALLPRDVGAPLAAVAVVSHPAGRAVAGPDRGAEIRKAVPTRGPLLPETQPAQVLRRQAEGATNPCGQAEANPEPHMSHGSSRGGDPLVLGPTTEEQAARECWQ